MSESELAQKYQTFEKDILNAIDKANRNTIECKEILERFDSNVPEYVHIVETFIESLKLCITEETGLTKETNDINELLSILRTQHTTLKQAWEAAKQTKEQLVLREKPLSEKISSIKQEIEILREQNKSLQEGRKQTNVDLKLLTKIMGVEYKQNQDSKIDHATVKIGDKHHRFNSFEQLEALLK